jgi:photosystem II stability/assembly factor-like uncharacterized protein
MVEEEEEEEKESNGQPGRDNPYEALRFRVLQQENEHGRIPPGALLRAAAQRDAMVAAQTRARQTASATGKGSALPGAAGIERSSWTSVGPGNIGGRIRSIVIHPTDPQTMWVGSVTGGVYKTENGGTSWAPLDDFIANLAVSALVSPTGTPKVLYAGTGEWMGTNMRDSHQYGPPGRLGAPRGAGVFKSEDGGTSWTQLPSTNTSEWWYVNRLAIDPNAQNTLLAATSSGVWRTTNGGTDWTKTNTTLMQDIEIDPVNTNNVIAGGSAGNAIYSTDGGQSWSPATGISGGARVEVAYHRTNPQIVYASVNQNRGSVYRSTDGGHSYTLMNNVQEYLEGQGDYDNALWVSPTNPNVIVVGGIDLWRSTDGGTNLTQISDWRYAPASAHADHHAIVQHPGYNGADPSTGGNRTIFFGNDGGIYKTSDVLTVGGTPNHQSGWQELNNSLSITQFYGADANDSTGTIVGGTQDNGTLRKLTTDGSNAWTEEFGGDGGFSAADQTDSNYLYGEYVYGEAHRSSDGGGSATYISGKHWNGTSYVWKAEPYRIPDSYNQELNPGANPRYINFIAPMVLDPNNANRLLVGGRSLWRTNDARTANTSTTGPSWTSIKTPLTSNSAISAITVQAGNSNVVYVGHNNSAIYKSTNATSASPDWGTRLDLSLPSRMVLRITVDPSNADIVYVTYGGFSADNVWRSTDGGTTWSSRDGSGTGTLPEVPVRSLVVNPSNSNWLYVGTEIGVFASEDAGLTWFVPNDGPANVPVDELFWKGTTAANRNLVAATFGRGIFTTPIDTASPPPNDDFANAQTLSGETASATGTNVGASKEVSAAPSEPNHAGNDGGASIWYRWKATLNGTVTIDTAGSTLPGGGALDTLLAVYVGDSVRHLARVSSNDDAPGLLTSRLSFTANAGDTYRIAVDGYDVGAGAGPAKGSVQLHLSQTGLTSGYPRPLSASPIRASLVPAYNPCAAPNRTHGAPLAFGSCDPPAQASPNLTVGTSDANGASANSVGFVRLQALIGDPGTSADEADVSLRVSITDVRCKAGATPCGLPNAAGGADYTGQLQLHLPLRLTDKDNGGAAGFGQGTLGDLVFPATVPCAGNSNTTVGGTCTVTTTADAITSGVVREGIRTMWQLGQLQVKDGGTDGVASTGPNSPFAVQGVFVP